jgi:hypothetical protein
MFHISNVANILLEKPTFALTAKELPVINGTRSFITVCTKARRNFLFRVR